MKESCARRGTWSRAPSGLAGTAPRRRAFALVFRVVLVILFVACAWLRRRVAPPHSSMTSSRLTATSCLMRVSLEKNIYLCYDILKCELLTYLRNVRSKIMKTENKPAYTIIGNKGLVSLATYRPENREEFIALYGLGETTYNAYGLQFIQAIKDFEKDS